VAAHRWRSTFAVIAQEHVFVGNDIPEIRADRISYLRGNGEERFLGNSPPQVSSGFFNLRVPPFWDRDGRLSGHTL
jgi:hypothetical protein